MSFIFRRYPPPSRRAIFFAREAALNDGAAEIDSTHLLSGLIREQPSRANELFKLDQRFPEEAARLRATNQAAAQKDIPLAPDSKKVLACAADEASHLDSYWIDTEHLTLGILRTRKCAAEAKLVARGLEIEGARKQVESLPADHKSYGAVPLLWQLAKPITRVGSIAGMWYLAPVVLLIGLLAKRGC